MTVQTPVPTGRETVLAEQHGAVRVLTLNRPARLNAVTDDLQQRYLELLEEADTDPDVRVIVVTGAGRGFCAGSDMDRLERIGDGWRPSTPAGHRRDFPRQVRKPIIGAINGAAAGIGLINALYCDIRFAVPSAKFTTAFVRRGLVAEYAISWLLPRVVGPSRALDLLLSGRVIDGREAFAVGLVDRLVEDPGGLLDEALSYANELCATCSPTAMATIKAQVLADLEADYETAYQRALSLMPAAFEHPDMREGVQSYLQHRPPRFTPLGVAGVDRGRTTKTDVDAP